jgi:hypothetical protein
MATAIQYSRLKTEFYTFYLTIKQSSQIHTLQIGGPKGDCVSITVNTPQSILVERGLHKLDSATIPFLAWDSRCAVSPALQRGQGTVHMIRTILSETVKKYPYIKQFTLIDNSHISCENGKQIALLYMSIAEHSNSWYERQFGAQIVDPTLRAKYQKGIQALQTAELKLSWDDFVSLLETVMNQSTRSSLQPYYTSSSTYSDFFKTLLEKEGKRRACTYLGSWIDIFFQYLFQFDPTSTQWAIPVLSVEQIPVEEELLSGKPSNQLGGRRTLRKRTGSKHQRVNSSDFYSL